MSKTKPIKEKKEKQEPVKTEKKPPVREQGTRPGISSGSLSLLSAYFRIQSGRSETTSSVRHGRFPILTMP